YNELIEELKPKKLYVFHNVKEQYGLGYKDLAKAQPIYLPKDADEQLRRVFVLLGSLNAQNNNPNVLKEFTALLDQLYHDKKITKLLYKTL
ncbi:hypothetical protein NL529_28655, partial [Klebsiella pneumoniae]|nr:hypothetical protein [Klebsiella pneumoniae]